MKNFLLLASLAMAAPCSAQEFSTIINPENVTIVRDQWGIPHIFGKTDADAAYGLAWANAEDNFFTMQELVISGTGRSGKLWGVEGAKRDFFVHAIGATKVVDEKYDQVPADYIKYLEGYCQGVNAFAKKYPKEVRVKGTFPVTPKDILKAYVFAMSAISFAQGAVGNIVDGKYDEKELPFGSNAFAFNSNKTTDGSTMLCVNPHQPVEGPFSWYEAHMVSDEGLNIHGALFPGGTSIFLGNNLDLGWSHTFNHVDLVDVFKLEMHPTKRLIYKYNGEWLKLQKRPTWLKVKLKGMVIPVRKMTYWSVAGATLISKNKEFYSVKFGANEHIRLGEQWYRMNKARNFTEFYSAVSMNQASRFNIIYADRNDTVFFINNALVPKRNPKYNYREAIGMNSSETLWSTFHPTKDLVQYVNPACGYVFNTNNIPTNATCEANQRNINEWPDYFGFDIDLGNNNRAERFMKLLSESDKVSYERMKTIKFDKTVRSKSKMYQSVEHLFRVDPSKYPTLSPLIKVINEWDGVAEKSSIGAGTFLLTFQHLFEDNHLGDADFKRAITITEEQYISAVTKAKAHLDQWFGGKLTPLGDIQRHVRANVNLPLHGFGDALAANYNQKGEKGTFKPYVADSYVHFAHWKKGERFPFIETLHPFGASSRPDSPHYTDQMQIYSDQKTKEMTLDKERIMREAKRVYHPK